ncbi:MAG: Coenzyme F420 hydrogenase/dehydrogenase, beta subunit C-terminal domain [Thermoplasmatota archaeon]
MGKGFDDLKREVIDPGLCTRCGGCAASCPVQVLEFNSEGIALSGDCIDCGTCLGICPGKGIDMTGHEKRLFSRSRKRDLGRGLGIYLDKEQLTSSNREIVKVGYYGGRVTSVLVAALEAGMIDAALLTQWAEDGSLSTGNGIIARTEEEVISAASSKYVFSSVLTLLPKVREDATIENAALVCLPCQVQAFRNMEAYPATTSLTAKVGYLISLNCGAPNMSEASWRKAASDLVGTSPEQVTGLKYWKISSTKVRVEAALKDGGVRSKELNMAFFLKRVNKGPRWGRCDLCPDYSGELSDLTFGAPVIRTERGRELLDNAKKMGMLKGSSFKKSVSQNVTDLYVCVSKKKRARRNIRRRRKQGLPYPEYR